jgi:ABC-type sugar transport system ATPase subunit
MRTTPVIELSGVGKEFGAVQALADIDLDVTPGEVHALVGENGAGKSTLGKIVMGAHTPSAGVLKIDGIERTFHSPRDALSHGLTGISQEIALAPQRSVMENVFLGREPHRRGVIRRRELRAQFRDLDERTGFGIPADAKVGSLSIADQQRVEILAAVARDARVIVMDEPTAALSAVESEQLFGVLRQLRASGTTVIYISHFLKEVLSLADRITVLRDGRIVQSGPAMGETEESLITSMLGRPLTQTFPRKCAPGADAPVRLSVRGVSRGRVRDVSFDVRAGEIVGLAGLIGSGRTETARVLFGADPAEHASVSVDERPVDVRSPRDAMRQGIVYLPESRRDDGLMMGRTGTDNVALPHLRQFSRFGVLRLRDQARRCAAMLERVQASSHAATAPVGTLSGGNQQKVLFGRCLLDEPKVFIADEPTRGIDIGAKVALYSLISDLASRGTAVVIISSEHEELIGLAHRVLVMRGGSIVAELEDDEINEENIVSAALTA